MYSLSLLYCIFLFCSIYSGDALEWGEIIVNDENVSTRWVTASNEFDDLIFPQKNIIIRTLDNVVANKTIIGISDTCSDSIKLLSGGLKERKIWAYQFMDASAKGKSGFTYGFISDFGNFDQCLGIKVKNMSGEEAFHGKYCMVNIRFPMTRKPERNFLRPYKLNLSSTELKDTLYEYYGNYTELFFYETFTLALCLPSTCSKEELSSVLNYVFNGYELSIEPRKYCEDSSDLQYVFWKKPWETKVAVFIIIILAGLVFLSTCLNYLIPGIPYASHFCAFRNSKKLTAEYGDESMKKLMFFDTFKCFFQLGGTFAHIICFIPAVPVMFAVIQDRTQDMKDLWILNELFQKAIYITQIILVISGFFTSYYMMPVIEKNKGKLNFFSYVFKRWLRTAPTLIGGILCMFALYGIVYGPLAEEINEKYLNACRKTWLYTILNINNFHVTSDVCLPQTWTQSADFHLWIIAYFPLLLLYRNPRKGIIACLSIVIGGIIIPSVVMFLQDLPSPIGTARPVEIMFLIVHGKTFPMMAYATYNNMSNYFLGVILGYCCVKNIKFNIFKVLIFNIMSWSLILLCFFGPHFWIGIMGRQFNPILNAFYAGIFKVAFGLVFVSCIYNTFYYSEYFPGFSIVKSQIFVAFGRLALSIYVSQLAPIGYYMAMAYDPIPVNWYTMTLRVVSIIIQIYILGYIVFLLFEAPSLNFGKNLNFKSSDERKEEDRVKTVKPTNGHLKHD